MVALTPSAETRILVLDELWIVQPEASKASFRHSRSVITVFEVLVIELMLPLS